MPISEGIAKKDGLNQQGAALGSANFYSIVTIGQRQNVGRCGE